MVGGAPWGRRHLRLQTTIGCAGLDVQFMAANVAGIVSVARHDATRARRLQQPGASINPAEPQLMAKPVIVTFDVYMALLDIEGSLGPQVRDRLGLAPDAAAQFVRVWRAKQMERAAASNSIGKGHTSFRAITDMALDYCLTRGGMELSAAGRVALVKAWDVLTPWPEADDCIAAIRALGVQTAILSNGDQDTLDTVAGQFKAGFDHVLSAETAGHYKPHPAVYDLPTRVLGIAKADVVHVAGSANDVLGTVAAGMTCLWSNRHGDVVVDPDYPPAAELADLAGVAKWIAAA